MTTNLAGNLLPLLENKRKPSETIKDRLSEELVFVFVGPVGSGVSTTSKALKELLREIFDYDVADTIKLSEIIRNESYRVSRSVANAIPIDERIDIMQTIGNELRKKFGGSYLAEKAVERIYSYKKSKGGYDENGAAIPARRAFIIDSIKNPEEIDLLRTIYQDTLSIIGVFAPDELRAKRLKNDGASEVSVKKIMNRDRDEVFTFGQKTRKIFSQADFFICNDRKPEELRTKTLRFLELLFLTKIHTPTRNESSMYQASSAAANSACMSRQVGAAIVSSGGEIVGLGWNDVPRYRGGLYNEDNQSIFMQEKGGIIDHDYRCFKWQSCICHNDIRKNSITGNIVKKLMASKLLKKNTTSADVRNCLGTTEIDSITEYSRAIHAEMEAILSVAREGKNSLIGSTLYTTTYPCHNCARHIVAAGIERVIYIEPYDKSLATTLHSDSITENPEEKQKVLFQQFDGVAPKHYLKFFRPKEERKKDGAVLAKEPKAALPVLRIQLDSPVDYEAQIIVGLSEKEKEGVI